MYINHPDKLARFQAIIRHGDWSTVHVLADFDGTLTKTQKDGKKLPSAISVLRQDGDYLGEAYALSAQALYDKYAPFESDKTRTLVERKAKMFEWWMAHYALLVESGMNLKHLNQILDAELLELKESCGDLFALFSHHNVPIIILSASGIGEIIPLFLKRKNVYTDNIHVISNRMEFDKEGNFTKIIPPVVHSLNKDEVTVTLIPEVDRAITKRKNVLLLGDSLGDLGMITGFEADTVLTVGFTNESETTSERYGAMKEKYDVIIEGDSIAPLLTLLV